MIAFTAALLLQSIETDQGRGRLEAPLGWAYIGTTNSGSAYYARPESLRRTGYSSSARVGNQSRAGSHRAPEHDAAAGRRAMQRANLSYRGHDDYDAKNRSVEPRNTRDL